MAKTPSLNEVRAFFGEAFGEGRVPDIIALGDGTASVQVEVEITPQAT